MLGHRSTTVRATDRSRLMATGSVTLIRGTVIGSRQLTLMPPGAWARPRTRRDT